MKKPFSTFYVFRNFLLLVTTYEKFSVATIQKTVKRQGFLLHYLCPVCVGHLFRRDKIRKNENHAVRLADLAKCDTFLKANLDKCYKECVCCEMNLGKKISNQFNCCFLLFQLLYGHAVETVIINFTVGILWSREH